LPRLGPKPHQRAPLLAWADSANDVGTGVQKTRKLIDRDQVSFIIGDVNSGIASAMTSGHERPPASDCGSRIAIPQWYFTVRR
jgi:hypothetical protein